MNTLEIEKQLAWAYDYKPLPPALSKKYRELFSSNIPAELSITGANQPLFTSKGTKICSGYDRIVVGDYGAFIEFSEEQIASDFICKRGEEFRLTDKRYNCKYIWLTLDDGSDIKIYHQLKTVKYADYKVGKYYISPHEVSINGA